MEKRRREQLKYQSLSGAIERNWREKAECVRGQALKVMREHED